MKVIEGKYDPQTQHVLKPQKELPNAVAAMVLGIISCAAFWCYGSGIVVAVIAKKKIEEAEAVYFTDPEVYFKSYKFIKVAKITSKIGFWIGIGFTSLLVLQIILELS